MTCNLIQESAIATAITYAETRSLYDEVNKLFGFVFSGKIYYCSWITDRLLDNCSHPLTNQMDLFRSVSPICNSNSALCEIDNFVCS